jgi:hypothetical protein
MATEHTAVMYNTCVYNSGSPYFVPLPGDRSVLVEDVVSPPEKMFV